MVFRSASLLMRLVKNKSTCQLDFNQDLKLIFFDLTVHKIALSFYSNTIIGKWKCGDGNENEFTN